ncbi:MAG: 2-pyrone-4,6-dicarboxylate hydrolase [Betaproteobacteria bacterium]|nr:MAG: 2-pyrone-4,6-dicarboxylate hydrolase [Betaproteobacteria bacterium]
MNLPVFDTHFHIIDFRFPVSENQGFLPPSFPVDEYRKRTAGLDIKGGVVVAGSFQNFDTTFMRDALAQLGPTFVGVVQIPADMPDAEIMALDAIGVRGVRFNLVRGGSAGIEDLDRVARRVHDLAGWHVELYADAKDLAPVFSSLQRLPAISIAHLGLSSEGLPTLLRLAERGMMVKATGFGRVDLDVPAAIRALAAANPDCLMFGSDLPSQRARRPFEPQDMALIRANIDPALERKVFFDNAVRFYRPREIQRGADA